MVHGFEIFKKYFENYKNQYVIIGGTACSILMEDFDLEFRATRDIDMVLIVEEINSQFGNAFWQFIKDGKYQNLNKITGKPEFYRFSKPQNNDFPTMIELFSSKPNNISLTEKTVVTPIPIEDEVSSLSAILLNQNYYQFLKSGIIQIDGISILDIPHLIAFKSKAYLDLSERKLKGERIDSKNIKKHRNDIFRLSVLLNPIDTINIPDEIYNDITHFLDLMQLELIDLKSLGLKNQSQEIIIQRIKKVYTIDKSIT